MMPIRVELCIRIISNNMNKHLNDPTINRKYNYLYKITNLCNGKIYIGVHRTDNLDDGYMGSGKILKRSKDKYGLHNFKKEILEFFDTYQKALDKEKELVNVVFIEDTKNYNIKEGGYGSCKWSKKILEKFSTDAKLRWQSTDYQKKMRESTYDNPVRNSRVSRGIKKWIENNHDKHLEKMDKINKNPEKIKNTAETHTGMKRSDTAKQNIKNGIINALNDPTKRKNRSGLGSFYIYNASTDVCKRHNDIEIPIGWIRGVKPKK